jgi:AcrR family transcriptional regulator
VATPTRRRSARGQGAALRGEVLTATMDLLAETGDEEAVSLRAVAQRVGVSVPSIYLHFADKQALLDAVCDQVFTALDSAMQTAAADAPHVFEGLRRQGIAYVRFAVENPEHYRIVLMRKHEGEAGEHADLMTASVAFQHFVDSVQACVDEGVFEGSAEELALQLWAGAHGLSALLVAKPYFPWPPVDELIDSVVGMVGIGLAARSRLGDDCDVRPLPEIVEKLNRLRE